MKALVFSLFLHLAIIGFIYLKGGFEPVVNTSNDLRQKEQPSNPHEVSKVPRVKNQQGERLTQKKKEELITDSLAQQKKELDRMTPVQKHRALDSHLEQLESVNGGALELLTMEVLKLLDGEGPVTRVENESVSVKVYDHESSFFTNVERRPEGLRISMQDRNANKLSYIIENKDITEDDLALLKLYDKSKDNKHLKLILETFAKYYNTK
ncbi:cell envelope integrity protein TolA [Lentisphaera profundi]|uniref:Cell envelope integrity protein TolA n=1 Tax=Lentisphaera profundi TaxID=1658616 RepID=A0ABY7VXV6_9BACT|nr:cell envelope integrity protein TolA [Lentisphaera profundi]WDE98050.1 cell envelope integrity protein TolA [Lentisphaera profundi]